MYDDMCRLVHLHAGKFLKKEVILAAGDKLKELKLDSSSQLTDEHLGIGGSVLPSWRRSTIRNHFFPAVRKFYLATTQKMLNKFPFGDPLMKNLIQIEPLLSPHLQY
jgi:hypothetical protein